MTKTSDNMSVEDVMFMIGKKFAEKKISPIMRRTTFQARMGSRLDVIKRKVHLIGFLASPFGSVALGIPDSLGHALLATELCDCSVDCHSPHDWDNSISLLASIYIEDCLESASHNSYFFVRCKIKL